MNFTRFAGVVVGTTTVLFAGAVAPAHAVNNLKPFGAQETLKDYVSLGDFTSEIGYTVQDLRPSSDPVPVNGRLYEANVMTTAVVGTVVPQPVNFLARTPGGADYRALIPASTLSGAPVNAGGMMSGKLYFDVTGENPDSVIYNANFEDLLGWVGPMPVGGPEVVPGTNASGDASGGMSGGAQVPGSTGPMEAMPPQVGGGGAGGGTEGGGEGQNGSYGPSGNTPPVGNN